MNPKNVAIHTKARELENQFLNFKEELVEANKNGDVSVDGRLLSIAATYAEAAFMFLIKAITRGK